MDAITRTRPRRPRGARRLLAAGATAMTAALLLAGCVSADQQKVLDLANADRKANGKSALTADAAAMSKAQAWSEHMASTGVLEHTGGGSKLNPSPLKGWCAYAENVGKGPNVEGIQRAFMASEAHRTNLLGRYVTMGTGVAKSGSYYWVTQIFLRPC